MWFFLDTGILFLDFSETFPSHPDVYQPPQVMVVCGSITARLRQGERSGVLEPLDRAAVVDYLLKLGKNMLH